eukprot:13570490-Ditylum_brightwellii.AAC.1
MLDYLVVIAIDDKVATRVEHWYGKLPSWAKALRVWGILGVVKIKTKTTPKLYNKCIACMFVRGSNQVWKSVWKSTPKQGREKH